MVENGEMTVELGGEEWVGRLAAALEGLLAAQRPAGRRWSGDLAGGGGRRTARRRSTKVQSLLDAPDASTRAGVRDRAMLHLTYAAGLRVSEATRLLCTDLDTALDTVLVRGKGRRERRLPLWKQTRAVLRDWLAVRPTGTGEHLFLNSRGFAMSRHGFAHRLAQHVETARRGTPSVAGKRVSPHMLRH